MSSISGASSILYPNLNALTGTDPSQQSLEGSIVSAIGTASQDQSTAIQPHQHHGQSGQTNPLFQQVQQSVTSALSSAQGNSSADANSIVEQAIESVLQQAQNSGGGIVEQEGDSGDGSPTAGGAANSTQESFDNTLKSYGIDPSQFRNDFLSAVKQAQSGSATDSSSVFGGFPPGLNFDQSA